MISRWRASGPFLSTLSGGGLLSEIRQFLLLLDSSEGVEEVQRLLVDGVLPQRRRMTRQGIVRQIFRRLVRWNPPSWVLSDLIAFANDPRPDMLRSALLIHVPRQDQFLYEVVQQVIMPRWQTGERYVARVDVQRFLDEQQGSHPEIDGWSYQTRQKVTSHSLSLLRDYGLLQGSLRKQIVKPIVFPQLVCHLTRLLHEEGVAQIEVAYHPDWLLWLSSSGDKFSFKG